MNLKAKLVIAFCVALAIAPISYAADAGTRNLPMSYVPGTTFTVTLDLEYRPGSVIVNEYLPAGWVPQTVIPEQTERPKNFTCIPGVDEHAGTENAKWLFLVGIPSTGTQIQYTVTVPSEATGSALISGEVLYTDDLSEHRTDPIGGDTQIYRGGFTPTLAFESASSSGSEGISPVTLPVVLSEVYGQIVTVNYSTGGTATSGVDYTLAPDTLTFSPGETTKNISLTIVDDLLDEANETVIVTLSNPTNATLGTPASHTYTIEDNNPPPSVEFTATSSSDVEAVSPATLVVNLSAASGRTVTVVYSVTGTATGNGEDYTLADGTLTFSPGDTSEDITIPVVNDSSGEGNETIIVTLSNPTSATLGTNTSHTYTIENDDASSVEFSAASSSGLESDSPATLVVVLLPALPDQSITVDYSVTASGTATGGGVDYTLADGSLTFSPGDTEENIVATIVDDSTQELNETFIVTLSNPSENATLGTNPSHTYTIINDDDETDPNTYGHIPEPNSIQVARDTIIQLHIIDALIASTSGVDANTVQIQVEGEVIYNGAAAEPNGTYNSSMGICRRVGSEADYTFVFQPSTLFDYEQRVDITVNATDEVGNVMPEETYHFYTVMRSFGKNAKVNSDTGTLVQNRPAAAMDSAGNIWVVWDETTAAGDTDIYIGQLEANGSAFGTSLPVVSDPNNQQNPAIAIDNSNNIYVAWEEINPDDPNGNWDVFVSTSSDGNDWSAPVVVNVGDPNNTSDQIRPSIRIDIPNPIYVAYQDNRAGNNDIWVATSTDGSTWAETQITTDANDQTEPTIAIDASNTAYVAWTDAGNSDTDIYGADSTTGLGTNFAVVNTVSNQSNPAGAVSGGVVHLLWVDDADPNGSIFYGSATGGFQGVLVMDPNVVDEPNYAQSQPAIAVLGTGASAKVFACWTDARWINSGDVADIYFAESGSGFDDRTNVLVNDDILGNTQTTPDIGIDSDGNPYMVWVDNRNGNNDIYYAGPITIGEPLPTEVNVDDVNEITTVEATTPDDLKVTVTIPDQPLGVDPTEITIRIVDVNDLPEPPPGGFGVPYDFSPSGLEFDPNKPVTITIQHNANVSHPSVCRAYWYDEELGWQPTGGIPAIHVVISPTLHAVTFETTHFTFFGVGGGAGGGGGGGGGGCSMSPYGQGNVAEFLLPYVAFVIVLLGITWVDARRRRRTGC